MDKDLVEFDKNGVSLEKATEIHGLPDQVQYSGVGSFADSKEYQEYLDNFVKLTFPDRMMKMEITVGREHLMKFFEDMMFLQSEWAALRKMFNVAVDSSDTLEEMKINLKSLSVCIENLGLQLTKTRTIFDAYKAGL